MDIFNANRVIYIYIIHTEQGFCIEEKWLDVKVNGLYSAISSQIQDIIYFLDESLIYFLYGEALYDLSSYNI